MIVHRESQPAAARASLRAATGTAGLSAVLGWGQTADAAAHAKEIFDLLSQDQFDEVATEFNSQVAAAPNATQLRTVWTTVREQTGAFQSFVGQRVTPSPSGSTAIVLGCQFEKTIADFLVTRCRS